MEYKFMQLGGNCACIGYLGVDRIRGPVDNVILTDVDSIKLLIENKYYDYVCNESFTITKRTPGWEGDSKYFYKYKHVWIAHHNPKEIKYQTELKIRVDRFNEFLQKVKTEPNYFFTLNLNEFIIEKKDHSLKANTLLQILEYLKSINLLSKVIFVSTKLRKKVNPWDYYSDDAYRLLDKYQAKHITIIDNDIWDVTVPSEQFLLKAKDIIENDQKIDLVVPYVDATDPEWQKVFNKYNPKTEVESVNAKNRFRGQGDFFRYFFRSVALNMPWINNLFLLVQSKSQVPNWLDSTKIKVITHSQFIPKEYLPTFNSGTIEMFIQNIPGLSEHFIYANDDIYALHYLPKQSFFLDNKCIFNYLWDKDNYSNDWRKMCQNNYDLIYDTKGAIPYIRLDHEFRPYLKSSMVECYKKYEHQLRQSISMFRSRKNLTIYLFSLYLLKNQLQMNTDLKIGYLCSTSSEWEVNKRLNFYDSICLNDTSTTRNIYTREEVASFFWDQFTKKSLYELNEFKYIKPPKQPTKPKESFTPEELGLPRLSDFF